MCGAMDLGFKRNPDGSIVECEAKQTNWFTIAPAIVAILVAAMAFKYRKHRKLAETKAKFHA